MVLADSNIWLALSFVRHPFHGAAQHWFLHELKKDHLAFCRSTQQSFLRLITTPSVITPYGVPAATNDEAWTLYEDFLADRRIRVVSEPAGLESLWKSLASRTTSSPKLWMDSYLATFAIAGRHRLITTDGAFQQYPGLTAIILQR